MILAPGAKGSTLEKGVEGRYCAIIHPTRRTTQQSMDREERRMLVVTKKRISQSVSQWEDMDISHTCVS